MNGHPRKMVRRREGFARSVWKYLHETPSTSSTNAYLNATSRRIVPPSRRAAVTRAPCSSAAAAGSRRSSARGAGRPTWPAPSTPPADRAARPSRACAGSACARRCRTASRRGCRRIRLGVVRIAPLVVLDHRERQRCVEHRVHHVHERHLGHHRREEIGTQFVTAPISSPPALPPLITRRSGAVYPSATRCSAAAMKSVKLLRLC